MENELNDPVRIGLEDLKNINGKRVAGDSIAEVYSGKQRGFVRVETANIGNIITRCIVPGETLAVPVNVIKAVVIDIGNVKILDIAPVLSQCDGQGCRFEPGDIKIVNVEFDPGLGSPCGISLCCPDRKPLRVTIARVWAAL